MRHVSKNTRIKRNSSSLATTLNEGQIKTNPQDMEFLKMENANHQKIEALLT